MEPITSYVDVADMEENENLNNPTVGLVEKVLRPTSGCLESPPTLVFIGGVGRVPPFHGKGGYGLFLGP